MRSLIALSGAGFALLASDALAYVGPGAGLSLLGALWGLLLAVGAALGFLLLWPLRRARRRRLRQRGQATSPRTPAAARRAEEDADA